VRDALVDQARAVQPALRKVDLTKERLKLDRETEELESSAPRKASYASAHRGRVGRFRGSVGTALVQVQSGSETPTKPAAFEKTRP